MGTLCNQPSHTTEVDLPSGVKANDRNKGKIIPVGSIGKMQVQKKQVFDTKNLIMEAEAHLEKGERSAAFGKFI